MSKKKLSNRAINAIANMTLPDKDAWRIGPRYFRRPWPTKKEIIREAKKANMTPAELLKGGTNIGRVTLAELLSYYGFSEE